MHAFHPRTFRYNGIEFSHFEGYATLSQCFAFYLCNYVRKFRYSKILWSNCYCISDCIISKCTQLKWHCALFIFPSTQHTFLNTILFLSLCMRLIPVVRDCRFLSFKNHCFYHSRAMFCENVCVFFLWPLSIAMQLSCEYRKPFSSKPICMNEIPKQIN